MVSEAADARYTLTEEEREHVIRLKEECDKNEVTYKSVFELAKYSFVASSIENPQKRLKESFSRIKRKREFEKKHKLHEYDLYESLDIVQQGMPNWMQMCGELDGKWTIGYSGKDVDGKFCYRNKNWFEHICVVEFSRYDLGAADLEEARKGMYIVVANKTLKGNPLNHARMIMRLRVLFDKMNANRVKGLYAELPTSLGWVANTVLRVMPSKIQERIRIASKFEKFDSFSAKEATNNLPESFGGSYTMDARKWFEMRSKCYQESEARVEL